MKQRLDKLWSEHKLGEPLPKAFYICDPIDLSLKLLNKVLVCVQQDGLPDVKEPLSNGKAQEDPKHHGGSIRAGRIVEVEAYGGADDISSHGHRGKTKRNEVMFGPPGHLYVYFTYGMHWCSNVVCGEEGDCAAVLLRALEPLAGTEEMFQARPAARKDTDLCSGPAKLTQALGITGDQNGIDLVSSRASEQMSITIHDDGTPPSKSPIQTTRIGVKSDLAWRWYVSGNSHVSRP